MKKFAMVFPGQGSQAIGMLSELAQSFPVVEQTFQQASKVLGYDLWKLVQEGEKEQLNETWRTQPALLTASVAIYRVWKENFPELKPAVMAGHSLGEYSALVCAGALDFEDAVNLVELRGKLMQKAVPTGTGAMYAIINLSDDEIKAACNEAAANGSVVAPVNYNSPGQVVIAGEKEAVEKAAELCKEKGAKRAMPLAVSVPSHCELMRPAADQLAVSLDSISIKKPEVDVIDNVDVRVEAESTDIRDALVRQLYCPVRWSETVSRMASNGVEVLIEMGPGKVLEKLTKRINDGLKAQAVNSPATLDKAKELLTNQE